MSLGMNQIAESRSWLHFKNPAGLVMSCRRFLMEEVSNNTIDVDQVIDFTGDEVQLPKGISDAAENASVFAADNVDDTTVQVSLSRGRVEIEGRGISGWYQERTKCSYDGDDLVFRIDPKLLGQIVKEHNTAEVVSNRLKVDTGKFCYVTSLAANNPEDDNDEDE